jgi:hypothetical protein
MRRPLSQPSHENWPTQRSEHAQWPDPTRPDSRHDPKEAALAAARCLNPHPGQVTDPEFLGSDFFDARDAVQVSRVQGVHAKPVNDP